MTHGSIWYVVYGNTAILVPSIKECPVEYSQAFYRSGLTTEVNNFSVLGNLSRFSTDLILGWIFRDSDFPHGLTGSFERLLGVIRHENSIKKAKKERLTLH